jgi:hypothetical protein
MNIPDPKEILLNVLTIIDYKDDKETFANQFLQLCMQRALVDIVEALPQDQQKTIQEEVTPDKKPEEVQQILQRYFSQEQYLQQLQLSTQALFQDYIQTITPTLSDDQKQKLQQYLTSIIPPEMLQK